MRLCSLPKFELVSCKEDLYIVDIFEDRDFILSNYTFSSWFLVRVPESRCDCNDDTF